MLAGFQISPICDLESGFTLFWCINIYIYIYIYILVSEHPHSYTHIHGSWYGLNEKHLIFDFKRGKNCTTCLTGFWP